MVWVNILRFSIQGNTCVSIWATSVQEQLELVGTCLGPYLLTLSYWPFSKTYCNCKCFSAREKKTSHSFLGGGNSNIFHFHPYLGKMNPFWRAYFSNGLVQPPTRFPFQKIPSKFGMDFFYDSMGFRSENLNETTWYLVPDLFTTTQQRQRYPRGYAQDQRWLHFAHQLLGRPEGMMFFFCNINEKASKSWNKQLKYQNHWDKHAHIAPCMVYLPTFTIKINHM